MKKYKLINRMAVAAIALVFSFAAMAQQGNGQNKPGECRMAKHLPNLSEDQMTQIEALKTKHLENMLNLRAEAKVLRAELHQLEIAEKADMNKINSKIDEISAVQNKLAKERSKHRQDVRNILTPEQRVIFDSRPHQGKGYGCGPAHGNKNRDHKGYGQGPGQGRRGPVNN